MKHITLLDFIAAIEVSKNFNGLKEAIENGYVLHFNDDSYAVQVDTLTFEWVEFKDGKFYGTK